jgi:hypothetical protein
MRQIARILVLSALAAGCASRVAPVVDREPDAWLPLVPGSRWVYDVEHRGAEGGARITDLRVEGIERADAAGALLWQVYDGDSPALSPLRPAGAALELVRHGPGTFETGLRAAAGGVDFEPRRHAAGRLLLPIDPRPGQRWTRPVELAGAPAKLRVEVTGYEDVTAPAGLYRRCLALRLEAEARLPARDGAPPARLRYAGRAWYAQGIGPVQEVHELERSALTPEGDAAPERSTTRLLLRDRFSEPPALRATRAAREQDDPARGVPREKLARLLRDGRFEKLEQELLGLERRQERGKLTSDALYQAYLALAGEDLARLDAFVEARPGSHVALAARGVHQHLHGWRARGNRLVRDTTLAQLDAMHAAFQRALDDHRAALELRPGLLPSLRDLLQLARAVGDERDERFLFEQLLARESDPVAAYRLYLLGLDPRWGGSAEEMLALADDAAQRFQKGDERLVRVRAEVLATTALVFERPESRDLERAERLWQEAVSARGGWRARRGAFQARSGRLREALADFDAHMKSYGADAGALQARGRVLRRLGWRELALADFTGGVRLSPRDASLHEDAARTLALLERHEPALAAWDRALALAPRDTSLWSGRAELLARIGRREEALGSLARAVELQPGDPRLQLLYADALWSARDPRAPEALRRYLDLTADRPELAAARASAEHRLASAPPDVSSGAADPAATHR